MKFRHEMKQVITNADALVLRRRLGIVMQRDEHSRTGSYLISSLYFDNINDKALMEKINGINRREKFRLRCYNDDPSLVFLEKKSKINGLCAKQRCVVDSGEVRSIIKDGALWRPEEGGELLNELHMKMTTQGLRPKTIVDYKREAFVYPAGNVRVTLDSSMRASMHPQDFMDPDRLMLPTRESGIILEVKWDEFLPDVIRGIVQPGDVRTESFSKYAACRVYG